MSSEFLVRTFQQAVSLKKSLNGQNCFKNIKNSRKTELAEILSACKFTAHYACRNAEMNLKSTTTNKSNFCKNKFID